MANSTRSLAALLAATAALLPACSRDDDDDDAAPGAAVPAGMTPKLLSTTSVQTTDTSTDGTWVAWSAKADAAANSQIFIQKATDPLAPAAITPATGWIDGGDSLHELVLSDGLLVWRGWDGSAYHIYGYDLTAAAPSIVDLCGAGTNVNCFHTRGRVAVWSGGASPTVYIYEFDTATLTSIPVTAVSTAPYPKTDGRFVTWMAGTWPVFDIYAYDLQAASPTPVKLTSGGWNAHPVVDDGIVAWYQDVSGNYEIYYADAKLAVPAPIRVTNNAVPDEYPQIDGGIIVWSASDGADTEIFYYDTNAASPSVVAVTDNTTSDGDWPSNPRIHDGLIAWSGAVTGVTGGEIFYYDLQAASPAVVRLTDNALDDRKPRVRNGSISWVADGETYAARR